MNFLHSLTLAALVLTGAMSPVAAADLGSPVLLGDYLMGGDFTVDEFDRRGRRPRVPGGSGCDDPRDLIEHPECRVTTR